MSLGRKDEQVVLLDDSDEAELPAVLLEANADAPRLNIGQRLLGGALGFLDSVAPVVAGTAIIQDEGVPTIPVPGDYAVTALAMIGTREALHALRVLGRRQQPLNYLLQQGDGSFVVGLAKESGKKLVAAIPPVLIAGGVSYGRDALFNIAMSDPEQHSNMILALLYLDGPLLRAFTLGALTMGTYALGQRLIECCVVKPPVVPPQENPQTRWYQALLRMTMRKVDALAFAEMGRQVFNTMGPALILHTPYSLLLGPFFDLFVLEPLRYLSEVPHPLKNADAIFTPRVTLLDDFGNEVVPEQAEPNKCRSAVSVTTRVAIACALFAGIAVMNRYASAVISARHADADSANNENDPAVWSTAERLGYEALLMSGVILTQRIIESIPSIPSLYRKISEYCRPSVNGLFGRSDEQSLRVRDDLEAGFRTDSSDDDVVINGYGVL